MISFNLEGVRFSYTDDVSDLVVDIGKWSVNPGEKIFLYGPSGCGKSTFLNIISGMLEASEGKVEVLGKRLDQMSPRQRDRFRAHHIGYVFQQFNLIPYLDAVANIQLARYFYKGNDPIVVRQEIEKLLLTLNVSSSDWYKPAQKLSIGQQQRIAIARAFINKPEILIADEPTSSLDGDNREKFMSLLTTLVAKNNTTLIFVSHDKTLSKSFDRSEAFSEITKVGAA